MWCEVNLVYITIFLEILYFMFLFPESFSSHSNFDGTNASASLCTPQGCKGLVLTFWFSGSYMLFNIFSQTFRLKMWMEKLSIQGLFKLLNLSINAYASKMVLGSDVLEDWRGQGYQNWSFLTSCLRFVFLTFWCMSSIFCTFCLNIRNLSHKCLLSFDSGCPWRCIKTCWLSKDYQPYFRIWGCFKGNDVHFGVW